VHDAQSVYHVPLLLKKQGLVDYLTERLKLSDVTISAESKTRGVELMQKWKQLTAIHERMHDTVTIALVGKYTNLQDSYISVKKALEHAGFACDVKVQIKWVEASDLELSNARTNPVKYHEAWQTVCGASGILVPGGFGERGTEGKIAACNWARVHLVPFLGICLGLQVAVIEFARNVCQLEGAHSTEFDDKTPHPVVIYMPEISKEQMGGTMRLGKRPTLFHTKNSTIRRLYDDKESIDERHRHRYEVNPKYVEQLEQAGLSFVGKDETGERMEIVELADHPYFVCTQYHPEYLTRPLRPSPPFYGFVLAAAGKLTI
jgi:CTP synthase